MKKLLTSISVALLAIVLCVAFSGCATNVSGKTYQFDTIEYETENDLSDEVKELLDGIVEGLESTYSGSITFNDDGTVSGTISGFSAGAWKQDGKTVGLYATADSTTALTEYTVSGSKLVYEYETSYSGLLVNFSYSITVTYTKA